ncbi:uncharacterized protein LOC132045830 [Lycium ferocissimum]|uniref:uncharacterized protein LOC132045830 n=1 Tax=Lycium ferocissimum TaxID=112874 RepID=UPI0028155EEC|nr:uncharacterized protein LOC132045830 [Lycium ferocissimum]
MHIQVFISTLQIDVGFGFPSKSYLSLVFANSLSHVLFLLLTAHFLRLGAKLYIQFQHGLATCNVCNILLGLVLLAVAISSVKGLPTADAKEKTASFAKKLGGNSGKLIQATAMDVSSSGLNQGFQMRGLI